MIDRVARRLALAAREPRRHLGVLLGLARGSWYILYFRLARRDVVIRFPFRAHARVTIEGPGSVFIDSHCAVYLNNFKGLSVATLSPRASVRIGKGCSLGGVAVRCRERVTIGDRAMTAFSLIQDAPFACGEPPGDGGACDDWSASPVEIGGNVWIAMQCIVLGGSAIADDCVISAGSVCHRYRAQTYALISGNPARRGLPVDRVQRLSRNP